MDRIEDIVLGVTMVLIGIAPIGFIATGRAHLVVEGIGFESFPDSLSTVLLAVFTLCGFILTAAGVAIVRYGRSESDTPSLY